MPRNTNRIKQLAASQRLARDAGGGAALEMALISPALFLFLFGIIEFARALWLQNALDYSVAEAARCASINPTVCATAAQIQTYAGNQSGYHFDASVFSVAMLVKVNTPRLGSEIEPIECVSGDLA